MKRKISLIVILGVMLLSCSVPTPVRSDSETSTTTIEQPPPENLGQILPIGAKAIMGSEAIELEVTKTQQQQALGLMYRKSLPDNRGMLFSFTPARRTRFWMMNVVIDLDMIFLRDGEIQAIEANVPPCNTVAEDCPTYGPPTPIDQVIELRGGRAAELGLQEGDRITVEFLDTQEKN